MEIDNEVLDGADHAEGENIIDQMQASCALEQHKSSVLRALSPDRENTLRKLFCGEFAELCRSEQFAWVTKYATWPTR